jgi:hypothetical protein
MNLIERLRDAARTTHGAESYIWVKPDDLQEAISVLESFQWIPVSERLPEGCLHVLVYMPNSICRYTAYRENDEWRCAWSHKHMQTHHITAWAALPTQPAAQ